MKAPSMSDRAVKVRAYLTDKSFGYENWHAAQFSGPPSDNTKPGLLLLFDTEAERDAAFAEPKIASRAAVIDVYAEGVTTGMKLTEPQHLAHLASAMKKILPPALLAELLDHLDPLPRFLAALREQEPAP